MGDLLAFRLRKQSDQWYILFAGKSFWFPNFPEANAYSDFLKSCGYVDADTIAF